MINLDAISKMTNKFPLLVFYVTCKDVMDQSDILFNWGITIKNGLFSM